MKIFIIIILVLLVIWILANAVASVCVFSSSVKRPKLPYPVLTSEDVDSPVVLSSKSWEKYRDVLQEGQRYYCLAGRQRVTITSYDGLTLVGTLIMPDKPVKGGLILVHGFHSSPVLGFGPILPFYLDLGYAVLLPQQRAHGESGGKYITYGVRERFDCRDWSVWLSEKLGADIPIFLDGVSMGAATVMMAVSEQLPSSVRGIIADCGYTTPYDIMKYVMHNSSGLPYWLTWPSMAFIGMECRAFSGFGLHEYSTTQALSGSKLPVLFIHGTDDATVPPEMTEQNAEACAGPKEVFYVQGAGHAASYIVAREECEKRLSEFLDQYGGF